MLRDRLAQYEANATLQQRGPAPGQDLLMGTRRLAAAVPEDDEDARLYQHQFNVRNNMAFDDTVRCNQTVHSEASWCPYGMAACFHLMVHR